MFNGPVIPLRPANRERPYEIKAQDKTGEVYLYDVIGDSWEGTTGKQFADDLKKIGRVDTLNVYINSPGGSVFDGTAIHNVLKRHSARKIVYIDGLAASIASVVAMAGDEIRIAANGMMMIHDPWAIAMGSAVDFRKMADSLDKVRETILTSYVERTTSEEDQLSEWMTAETWFTAEEAVEAGLADVITEKVAMAALARHDLSAFQHVPEPLAKAAEEAKPEYQEGRPHPTVALMEARLLKRNHGRETA
jgi:ATP-dependent Clp protease protease subunit